MSGPDGSGERVLAEVIQSVTATMLAERIHMIRELEDNCLVAINGEDRAAAIRNIARNIVQRIWPFLANP